MMPTVKGSDDGIINQKGMANVYKRLTINILSPNNLSNRFLALNTFSFKKRASKRLSGKISPLQMNNAYEAFSSGKLNPKTAVAVQASVPAMGKARVLPPSRSNSILNSSMVWSCPYFQFSNRNNRYNMIK